MTKALADLFFGTKAAVVGFACFRIPMLVCLRGSRLEPYSEPKLNAIAWAAALGAHHTQGGSPEGSELEE